MAKSKHAIRVFNTTANNTGMFYFMIFGSKQEQIAVSQRYSSRRQLDAVIKALPGHECYDVQDMTKKERYE